MCKKMMTMAFLVSLLLAIGVQAQSAPEGLAAYWTFDEGDGKSLWTRVAMGSTQLWSTQNGSMDKSTAQSVCQAMAAT